MLYTWAVFSTPQATRKHRVFGPHASFIFTVWGGGGGPWLHKQLGLLPGALAPCPGPWF